MRPAASAAAAQSGTGAAAMRTPTLLELAQPENTEGIVTIGSFAASEREIGLSVTVHVAKRESSLPAHVLVIGVEGRLKWRKSEKFTLPDIGARATFEWTDDKG